VNLNKTNAMKKVFELFPIPLYQTSLNVDPNILEFIKSQKFEKMSKFSISKDPNILELEELHEVKNLITEKVKEFFYDVCQTSNDVYLELSASWGVWLKEGDYSEVHSHANSVISGVWYLSTTENSGDFVVARDVGLFGNTFIFGPEISNSINQYFKSFKPNIGDMYIFPSTLKHKITECFDDTDRISIAFNFMVRGKIKSENAVFTL
jgi:uncharacterized protein (TIGR02466 family)